MKQIQAPGKYILIDEFPVWSSYVHGAHPLFHSATPPPLSLPNLAKQPYCHHSSLRLLSSPCHPPPDHTHCSCAHCPQGSYVTIMGLSIAPSTSEMGCQGVKIRLQFCLLRYVYSTERSNTCLCSTYSRTLSLYPGRIYAIGAADTLGQCAGQPATKVVRKGGWPAR
jgi:hypothetical protein